MNVRREEDRARYRAQYEARHPCPKPDWHWTDVRLHTIKKLGYAWFYMKYLNPNWDPKQRKRVKRLCREVAAWREAYHDDPKVVLENNLDVWMRLYNRVVDEIENMC